jgi:predicted DNA-binding transcriptional regulator AlpA
MSHREPAGAWARVRRAAAELTPEAIEQIAQRVAELLGRGQVGHPPDSPRLLEASQLAHRLGVSREWVYEHATELGAITIGDGPKPRLRFDPEMAAAALARRRRSPDPVATKPQDTPPRRRRPRPTTSVPLLPVHAPRSRGIVARLLLPGKGRR